LGNVEEVLEKFKGRIHAEVRRQEKINIAKERNFRRGELLRKILYDGKFKEEYLRKLERNWQK